MLQTQYESWRDPTAANSHLHHVAPRCKSVKERLSIRLPTTALLGCSKGFEEVVFIKIFVV
jgi:hypothetical protein